MSYRYRDYVPHYYALWLLGLPIVVGQLGQVILGFADTMMIGHYATAELGASSFVNTMFNLVLVAALGFSYGLTPVVGMLHGQKQRERIGEMVRNGLSTHTVLALLLVLVMAALYVNLHRLGQPHELIPLMRPYFIVLLVSLPFVLWFNCLKQFFDGITRTTTSMWVILSGNLLNILLNWFLIYGVGPFPELGLLGAGVATLVARVYMCVALLLVFFLSSSYADYRRGFAQGRVNRPDSVRLYKLGFPLALQMGMETASFSLTSIFVGWIGTTALAAHQVVLTVSTLCFMLYYGMAAAVSVRVSFFHGQANYVALRRTTLAGYHLILFLSLLTALPLFFMRNSIGAWFADDAEVSALVAATIVPFVLYQFGDGLQCNYANALRGLSCVRPMMYIAFFAYFVVSLPLAWLFGIAMGGGLVGVWYSFPFGLTTAGMLYYLTFRQRYSQIKK